MASYEHKLLLVLKTPPFRKPFRSLPANVQVAPGAIVKVVWCASNRACFTFLSRRHRFTVSPLNLVGPQSKFAFWRIVFVRYGAWICLAAVLLVVVSIRVRLLSMPLDREEGECAYTAHLLLEEVPPYSEIHNVSFPGLYGYYALMFAVFGQTSSGFHLGALLLNVGAILLVFSTARRLIDDVAAGVAALVYGLVALSPDFLGLSGNVSHFLAFLALLGLRVFLELPGNLGPRAGLSGTIRLWRRPALMCLLLGFTLSLSFITDHRGLALLVMGPILLFGLWVGPRLPKDDRKVDAETKWRIDNWARRKARARRLPTAKVSSATTDCSGFAAESQSGLQVAPDVRPPDSDSVVSAQGRVPAGAGVAAAGKAMSTQALFCLSAFLAGGFVMPLALVSCALRAAGVLPVFWSGTFLPILRESLSFHHSASLLRSVAGDLTGPTVVLWLLSGIGLLMLFWDWRITAHHRFALGVFVVGCLGAMCLGPERHPHSLLVVLPPASLLVGLAVSRAIWLLRHDLSAELFLSVPILLVFLIGTGVPVVTHGSLWFAASADSASKRIYGTSMFSDSVIVGDFLRSRRPMEARLAVLGSEPQIYFYSHRRPAVRDLYQRLSTPGSAQIGDGYFERLMRDCEQRSPGLIVAISPPPGVEPLPGSERVSSWWKGYWPGKMRVVQARSVLTQTWINDTATGKMRGKRRLFRESKLVVFEKQGVQD